MHKKNIIKKADINTGNNQNRIDEIRQEIENEEKDIIAIRESISKMKESILDKEPSHFSRKEILKITFGSLAIGFAFIFSSALIKIAINLDLIHLELIILFTMGLLIAEIYFVWSNMVKDKAQRKFSEFLTKRLISLYLVAIISSFFLIYILNIDSQLLSFYDIMKLVVMMSMPCSVGAALPSMLKQY
jgi:uncharacterized membrane protein